MNWIKTSERMPELTHKLYDYCGYEFWMSDPVILVYEGATAIGAYAGEDGWCLLNGDQRYTSGEVTHWMPLPEPPKEEEDAEAIIHRREEDEAQREYYAHCEYEGYCRRYEPTYNPEDGSM